MGAMCERDGGWCHIMTEVIVKRMAKRDGGQCQARMATSCIHVAVA
jgi:hypothetical protein